jgi:hypothetical protein
VRHQSLICVIHQHVPRRKNIDPGLCCDLVCQAAHKHLVVWSP